MRWRFYLGFLLALAWATAALADGPDAPGWRFWLYRPLCPFAGSCPDYAPKPIPCVPPIPCGGKDDYCKKPIPCVPAAPCGGVDDYCKKPMPPLVCPWRNAMPCR